MPSTWQLSLPKTFSIIALYSGASDVWTNASMVPANPPPCMRQAPRRPERNLSERRIFPAIDLPKSSTRRDDLLLTQDEAEVNDIIRHAFNSSRAENAVEKIISMFARTRNNREFCEMVKKTKLL